ARAGVAAENPNTASVPGWSSKVCAGASRYATRNEARAAPVMRLRPGRFDTWVRAFRQGLDSNPSCYTNWLIQRDVGAPEHDPADPCGAGIGEFDRRQPQPRKREAGKHRSRGAAVRREPGP